MLSPNNNWQAIWITPSKKQEHLLQYPVRTWYLVPGNGTVLSGTTTS